MLSETGVLALQTMAQYATEERILNIVGDYNQVEQVTFSGAMLKGKNNANYFNVRVKTYGRQVLSRTGREQLVRTLLETRLLDPVVDRETLLHVLGTADIITIYDKNAVDRANQFEEIKLLLNNQPADVIMGQNHAIHIDSIKKCLTGKLFKLTPEQRNLLVQHLIEHIHMQTKEAILPQLLLQSAIQPTSVGGRFSEEGGTNGR
jgi:hypothetical protein